MWRRDGPSAGKCIWELHDVWGWDKVRNEGVMLRENYFKYNPVTGKKVCIFINVSLLFRYHSEMADRSTGIPIFISRF